MSDRILVEGVSGYPPMATKRTGLFRYADTPVNHWFSLDTMLTSQATFEESFVRNGCGERLEQRPCTQLIFKDTIPYGTIRIKRKHRRNPAFSFLEKIKSFLETSVVNEQELDVAIA